MAGGPDGTDNQANLDAVTRLSRMVAGNDHLVTQPGLVLALFQNNATPQQAQAINQFIGGLRAENMVRTAASAGHKVFLSGDERSSLSAMGIDYSSVEYTQQDAKSMLESQMARHGLKPVYDEFGNVQTDADGNVKSKQTDEALFAAAAKHAEASGIFGDGGFFHALGNNPITHFITHGTFDSSQDNAIGFGGDGGVVGAGDKLMGGYNILASAISGAREQNSNDFATQAASSGQNADLAKALGYDPESVMSMLAFRSRGLQHNDTSNAASEWNDQNPTGLFGWDGGQAALEAEKFAADPRKYVADIAGDASLTSDEAGARIDALSSKQFKRMVDRVNADKADIGTDVARGAGIDPSSGAFQVTAAVTNLAAAFMLDPLAFGLGAVRSSQIAATSVKGFTDAQGITRIMLPETAVTNMAQANVIAHGRAVVQAGKAIREAVAEGDTVRAAQLHAQVQASNPFAGLLGDVLGEDRILAQLGEKDIANLGKHDLPFVTGKSAPIETYDEFVGYLASKSALLRLQGGYAPVQTSVMPGALSSWGFLKFKGKLAFRAAGRSAEKSEATAAAYVDHVAADPGRLASALDAGFVTRVLPGDTDAIDVLSGKVLSATAEHGVTERAALDTRTRYLEGTASPEEATQAAAELSAAEAKRDAAVSALASARRGQAAAGDVSITDAGRGMLRGNELRYGTPLEPNGRIGKFVSIYTLGAQQRAAMVLTRFTNWLPRDTYIDLGSASSADTVRKIARTYLTSGDANLLAVRWHTGDLATRKTIVSGLKDQIAHAAGLPRTKAGQDLMASWKATEEKYASFGREFTDVNGAPGAQWPGQVQTRFYLPNFGAVHKAAAKVGLYEGTMGRLFTYAPVEKLLIQWKLGALFTPVTALRANLESWINAHAEGMFADGVRAKAVLRDAGRLSGEDISRSGAMDKVLSLAPLQAAGRYYRHVAVRGMDEDVARAITEMPDDLMHAYIHDQAAYHYAMSVDPGGVGEATAIARQGFRPGRVSYESGAGFDETVRARKGYEVTNEVDSVHGANLYAHNLAMRVNKSPAVARAVLDRIENPALPSQHVVDALEADRLMGQTLFGKVFIRKDGTQARAVSAEEIALGKQDWADQVTKDMRQLVTGRNGVPQQSVIDHIRKTGKAPDADWILDKVKGMNRPAAMLKPIFVPLSKKDGVGGIVDDLLDMEGKGYQWLVERLIQRHTTAPLFSAAYGDAKVGLEQYKQQLIRSGLTDVAAEKATAHIAADQAWSRIARMVDDPHMKSQMDVVGRSFFAFSRATTMMLRRWGGTFWRNPAQARRYQLAAEAAHHSGLVYTDENGNDMFHFPASGVAQEVLFHAASHIPGLEGLAEFPVSDFTGRVSSIIPGSSNPFQYSTNPMVSISMRKIAGLFPQYREWFDEVDRKLNGDMGQGQGFWATLEPNLAKKFLDPRSNERDSLTASAVIGSLYDLYGAGHVPKDGASPSDIQAFLGRLQTQTKSKLYLRAIFGALSPATIGVPDGVTKDADFAFAYSGAQGLRDEFKELINATDGDFARAASIWTYLHPDLPVYTQSGSRNATARAELPATQRAFAWMNTHADFIDKYKSVAAFFVPPQQAGEPYSMAAYRAQLEEGLRQRKTPQEFLDGVYVASGATEYYAMEDQYRSDLDAAKASGDTQLASQHRADWLAWSKQFKAAHPSFGDSLAATPARVLTAKRQIADLRSMVASGQVPGGRLAREAVAGMVEAYDGYVEFASGHPGGSNEALADRSAAQAQLQDYLSGVIAAVPALADLYRGVFRVLDHQLTNE